MELFEASLPVCPRNCSEWARVYLKYCLCNAKDGVSLTVGLISVISWGIAEVPQIITNHKRKSTEGLSIGFLVTWIIGDLFNLVGCMLEPATLPTQYYMALLYTATTLILTAQTIYYCHIYPRFKANRIVQCYMGLKHHQVDNITKSQPSDSLKHHTYDGVSVPHASNGEVQQQTMPIPVGSPASYHSGSPAQDLYYMSARSLSMSHTPTTGSFLAYYRPPGRTPSSSIEEPLLGNGPLASPTTKSMLCVVSGLMFFCLFDFPPSGTSMFQADLRKPNKAVVIQLGRKLLENNTVSSLAQGHGFSMLASFLGWGMAVIYIGGRLPQIWLNVRRGNVEGLNPFMFIFALVGNATYMASILVSSLEWSKLRPNLPWLVDAAGCIILDCFILLQFAYYRSRKLKYRQDSHSHHSLA